MPRSAAPMTMTFPPFSGAVRKIVLANIAVFLGYEIVAWLAPPMARFLLDHVLLIPAAVIHGQIWQLASYSFFQGGLLDILFGMLTIWFCGSILEGAYGSRWLTELYFTSVIGGALFASALSFTHLLHLNPADAGSGAWAGTFCILIAIATRFGDLEFLLFFVIRIRAKYMVAIYILIAVAVLLKDQNAFGALLELSGAACGYVYLRYAPRRGFAFGFTEQYYGLRNAYYRAKRRRAARKFEVYMGKQGRQVHFDKEGRYLDPDERRDPNDKRWMN
jgi:membrane associated rhomboid family serine protease